jgi:hypothetical protein
MWGRMRSLMLLMLIVMDVGSAVPTNAQGGEPHTPTIDPANFVEGVDNPFFPLTPGMTYTYEGVLDGVALHTEVSVMSETREILGVKCVEVRDVVSENGEMIEETVDWYAQDKDGNVWYMGEDSKEIEGGSVVSTEGSWEAGVDGAKPGVIMWGQPKTGEPYRQEYYAGKAEDMAQVVSLATSPSGIAFLVTREWSPLEPGIAEQKYYVAGIGQVAEMTVEGGEGRMELVKIATSPK